MGCDQCGTGYDTIQFEAITAPDPEPELPDILFGRDAYVDNMYDVRTYDVTHPNDASIWYMLRGITMFQLPTPEPIVVEESEVTVTVECLAWYAYQVIIDPSTDAVFWAYGTYVND